MLTVTDDAVQAIEGILEQSPEGTGIRIAPAADEDSGALSLRVVDAPEQTDQVIESEGGPLFVEESASEMLDDKTLDATVDDEQVQFEILPQVA